MTLENPALEIKRNSLKKMTLENPALEIKKSHQALQITQNTLEENYQTTKQQVTIKKTSNLKKRRNLKIEIVGLKILPLKNIAKKELKFKIF